MKKLLSGIFASLFCLSLVSCGGKAETPFDPAADAQTLLASNAFSESLTEIDPDIVCTLYGIDPDTVSSFAAYGSTGATAEELAIFSLTDADAAETALTALQYRVDDRIEELTNYLPDEITKLENAVLQIRGSSVLLVIAADYDPIYAFLEQ